MLNFSDDDKSTMEYYEGEFKDGVYHGQGKQKMKKGSVFEGTFTNGKRNGKGTISK